MILSLDTSTITGWAAGRPGERPQFGERHFGSGRSNGEVLCLFRHWLNARCDELRPTSIWVEAPYVPSRFSPGPPMNALTMRRLLAMAVEAEAVAWERRIEYHEPTIGEIAKFFLGNARQGGRANKKAATIKMCSIYGWDTTSDNAADALALWHYAEFNLAPQIASQRLAGAKRELPLHGTLTPQKTEAPRGQTSGLPDAAPNHGNSQCQTRMII